jgi:hypothetical protein
MKTKIQSHNTKTTSQRNALVAHSDGRLSVRINGKWSRGLRELSRSQYLSLLERDRQRLVLMEFRSCQSLTGCPLIVSRPVEKGASNAVR